MEHTFTWEGECTFELNDDLTVEDLKDGVLDKIMAGGADWNVFGKWISGRDPVASDFLKAFLKEVADDIEYQYSFVGDSEEYMFYNAIKVNFSVNRIEDTDGDLEVDDTDDLALHGDLWQNIVRDIVNGATSGTFEMDPDED